MSLKSRPPAAASDGSERRQSLRQASNFSANIILDNGARIGCVVRDFSKTGALLIVTTVLGIPSEFKLQAATGHVRRVAVMRRGTSKLGVRFV